MQLKTMPGPARLAETIFDILYLSSVLVCALLLLLGGAFKSQRWLFGIMALILVLGDSFHLIPRVLGMWDNRPLDRSAQLGRGKLIASLTMTVFYVILWQVGTVHYTGLFPSYMTSVVYALALSRLILCLFPQNGWSSAEPSLKWAIWRNIPFLALGLLVTVLFALGSVRDNTFSYLWLAILISFACYMPVVLFSGRNSKVGMLMLPKSCAYVAMVLIGFSLPAV